MGSDFADFEFGPDVQVLDHLLEFLVVDFAVEVQVSLDDGPVHQLLQLQVGQVVAHHHLEHRKQLPVRDEPVLIDVVDLERKLELLFVISAVQGRDPLQELLERDFAIRVCVENGNNPLY